MEEAVDLSSDRLLMNEYSDIHDLKTRVLSLRTSAVVSNSTVPRASKRFTTTHARTHSLHSSHRRPISAETQSSNNTILTART